MADILLFSGEGNDADVKLRSLPEPAPAAVTTDIFLLAGEANPADVLLRGGYTPAEPVVVPVVFSGSPVPIYKKGERVHRRGSVWVGRAEEADSGPWPPRNQAPIVRVTPFKRRLLKIAAAGVIFLHGGISEAPPPEQRAPAPTIVSQTAIKASRYSTSRAVHSVSERAPLPPFVRVSPVVVRAVPTRRQRQDVDVTFLRNPTEQAAEEARKAAPFTVVSQYAVQRARLRVKPTGEPVQQVPETVKPAPVVVSQASERRRRPLTHVVSLRTPVLPTEEGFSPVVVVSQAALRHLNRRPVTHVVTLRNPLEPPPPPAVKAAPFSVYLTASEASRLRRRTGYFSTGRAPEITVIAAPSRKPTIVTFVSVGTARHRIRPNLGGGEPLPAGGGLPTDTFPKGTASSLVATPLQDTGEPVTNVPSGRYYKSTRRKIAWKIGS